MPHSVFLILAAVAFVLTLASAISGKIPLWIPVLIVTIALLVQAIPANSEAARNPPASE